MYKEALALNNLQWLICHKTKQIQTFIAITSIFNLIQNGSVYYGSVKGSNKTVQSFTRDHYYYYFKPYGCAEERNIL